MQSASTPSPAYTEGPWHVAKHPSGSYQIFSAEYSIASLEYVEGDESALYLDANARLIAAAPDGYILALSMRNACEVHLRKLNSEMSDGREGADDDELDDLQAQIDNWSYLSQQCETFLATVEDRSS